MGIAMRRSHLPVSLLFFFLFSTSIVHADWRHLGLENNRVECLRLHEGNLYAATDQGIWSCSLESAAPVWNQLGLEDIHLDNVLFLPDGSLLTSRKAFGSDLQTHSILFRLPAGASEWDTLYYSTTWLYRLAAPYMSSDSLLATSDASIHLSTNQGETWPPVHLDLDWIGMGVHFFHFPIDDPGIFWSGGENPVFIPYLLKSLDRGQSWEFVSIAAGDNACYCMITDPNNADHIWVGMEHLLAYSENGGTSWTFQHNPHFYVFGLEMDPRNSDILYATGAAQTSVHVLLERSMDGGETWEDLSTELDGSIRCSCSQVHNDVMELYLGTSNHGVWRYRDEETNVHPIPDLPQTITLSPVYPNPFNSSTTFTLTLPTPETVHIQVFDLLGREVDVLKKGQLPAGIHRFIFDAHNHADGVYILKTMIGTDQSYSKRMVYIK